MIDTPTPDARQLAALCASSPAKINLTLSVLGQRSDGYHDIRSLVVGLDFYDALRFIPDTTHRITLTCTDPCLPTDDRNLVVRAARALLDSTSNECCGVRIDLRKRIPVAAGLGGGSGNAAATLMSLNRLWALDLPERQLIALGAQLGADIPLFFALPSALVSGFGETVTPTRLQWAGWVLLIFGGCPVSTRDVYAAWQPQDCQPDDAHNHNEPLQRATTAAEVAKLCHNDLEPAIFRVAPKVRELVQSVRAAGAPHARITGAGQTVFVLFDDPEDAEMFGDTLQASNIGAGTKLVKTLDTPPIYS